MGGDQQMRRTPTPAGTGRTAGMVATLVGVVGMFLLVVRLHPGAAPVARAVDDLGQLVAAGAAAGACGWRSRRSSGAMARSWRLLAAGTAAWALGETAWSYYELVAGRETPFPSVADSGFLLFPLLAVVGLLLWPSDALRGTARWRALLDGVLVAGALFIVSWVTALGTTVHSQSHGAFDNAVALAYPITDLILLTLTVVVVAHARRPGSGLGLVAVGLMSLCVADSGFAYLVALGRYATGSVVDAGWVGGFLLIAAGALTAQPQPDPAEPSGLALESTLRAMLPYIPAGLGLAVAVASGLTGDKDRATLSAAAVVIVALLARQLIAVTDNRRLVRRLVDAQDELRHQAFHDPLTGLANRALFANRLRHGLELHRRDRRAITLLYCDLDNFKAINDLLGHEIGDAVLRAAAERLRAVTRPGDTVARMGGDEFAVLLEDGGDADSVVARIFAAFAQPASAGQHVLPLATSIGVAALGREATSVDPETLLQRADAAMYRAKRNGKGHAVTWATAPRAGDSPLEARSRA